MHLPPWIFIAVGVVVIAFGIYRIRLSVRSDEEDEAARRRGGLYGVPRRTHLLFGIVYLLMGVILILSAFGINLLHWKTGR